MSEKVERCKFFLQTGISTKIVPAYKECNRCPLRNKDNDCLDDIVNDTGAEAGIKISSIWCGYWRDYYEKRSQRGV